MSAPCWIRFCQAAVRGDTVVRSLQVMLVVGTILNLINQGDALWRGDWGAMQWGKVALTYAVPYLVATYAAASAVLKES